METSSQAKSTKPEAAVVRLPVKRDWIADFCTYTENINSPAIFRKWTAIYTIAASLERKVWTKTLGSIAYPNLYVILVSNPGVGKSEAVHRASIMLESLEEHHIAASSLTKAALIDNLKESGRRVFQKSILEPPLSFHSLSILSTELGVLIPQYDMEFMAALTDLWDCKSYSEMRRTKSTNFKIDNVQLNMLAGCTPAYLMTTLPEGAWDQGFLSRVTLIFSGERQIRDLFLESPNDKDMENRLKQGIKHIGNLLGAMKFSPKAAELINNWNKAGQPPQPDHPKLANYSTRRVHHLIKLCMIASANHSDSLIIDEHDFNTALDWMIEAEAFMPDIFKAMKVGGDSKAIEDTWHFVYSAYMREGKKPILESRIIHFLSERVPAHNIMRVLEMMVRAAFLIEVSTGVGKAYRPAEKKA